MSVNMLEGLEYKGVSASAPPASVVVEGSEEGVVEALVAVTNVVDNVNDLILPGAFQKSLAMRKPKGVFSHDMTVWCALTEAVEELLPGDPRLLEMTTKAGLPPLPPQAGALWVKARFNMRDPEALSVYEKVRFFGKANQCEWSIGYQVPKGGARRDTKTGVRYIKELQLFEYSPVLFGANSLSMTLSVKSGVPGVADTPSDEQSVRNLRNAYVRGKPALEIAWGTPDDYARCVAIAGRHMPEEKAKGFCANRHHDALGVWPGREHGKGEKKALPVGDEWADLVTEQDGAEDLEDPADANGGTGPDDAPDDGGPGVMVALMLDPQVAGQLAVPGGEPPEQLHITLAYLGKGLDNDAVAAAAEVADRIAAQHAPLAGQVGGIGAFPAGDDGVPVFAPVDVPGLEVLRQHLVDALDGAGVPVMTNHGYTPHVTLLYAQPGDDLPAPVEPVPVVFDAVTLAVNNDHQAFPLAHGPDAAANTPEEMKGVPGWEGSVGPFPDEYGQPHVYARNVHSGSGNCVCGRQLGAEQHVQAAPGVAVPQDGQPVEMKGDLRIDLLRAAGVPIPMSYEELGHKLRCAIEEWFRGRGDKVYVDVEATFPEMVLVRAIDPEAEGLSAAYQVPYTVGPGGTLVLGEPIPIDWSAIPTIQPDMPPVLAEVGHLMKHLPGLGELETKAGRVLSDANAKKLKGAVLTLLEILKRAGIDIVTDKPEWPKDRGENEGEDLLEDPVVMPDSTAPSALPNEMKMLTAEELAAGLEVLRAAGLR